MSKTLKWILGIAAAIIALLLYLNIRQGSKEIKGALDNLESSKRSLDNATKKVEESSALVSALQQNVASYSEQVQHSDSMVRELEKRRLKTEQGFYSRLGKAQGSYLDLKSQVEHYRRLNWPIITIDTTR